MTEEPKTPTPALRLKPRLRPPGEAASLSPAAAPAPVGEAPAVPAPAVVESVKFRLKPKTELATGPGAVTPDLIASLREPGATIPPTPPAPREIPPPPAPAPFPKPPAPVAVAPAPAPAPATGSSTTRPPFTRAPMPKPGAPAPVVRSARHTVAPFPVPHLKVAVDVPEEVVPPSPAAEKRGSGGLIASLVAVVVFGAGGYFAWRHFAAKPAPAAPAIPAPVAAAPTAAAAPAKPAPAPAAAPAAGSTPSDTLNKIAHLPVNAINKAQDAIAARRASGQTRVDAAALGEDQPAKAAPKAPAAPSPNAANTATAMTAVAPGLAATTVLEAAEASPAFVAWVVASKVNGVFQGNPARAMINGRLTRTGEIVDAALGITFDRVDADKKQLIFKDGTGATVTRKY